MEDELGEILRGLDTKRVEGKSNPIGVHVYRCSKDSITTECPCFGCKERE